MPVFEIGQYELHVLTHRIEADDEAQAIAKLYQGEGEAVSFEFVGIANDFGMPVNEDRDLADQLFERGIITSDDTIVPSIRSIRQVE
jgi:hypothetical protein